ncbi:MAG: LapA family protein [Candidatus Pacebacteria bacterium]|nr:LapA family protein [Candidatus Paceibacterota bacterium]
MFLFLILGLLIGALTVIFALQNMISVSLNFLVWQIEGSLALILILALIAGFLVSVLLSIPEIVKTRTEFAQLKKRNKQLEDENANFHKALIDGTLIQNPPLI